MHEEDIIVTQCVVGVLFHVEAVSLTCNDDIDDDDDTCPGTDVTCTCSVLTAGVLWRLPGSETILLDDKLGSSGTDGTFFAVITNKFKLEESWSPC